MSRLEAEIPFKNLKMFAKTISTMAKIGNEVFIEGREDKIVLRALNASRSAFTGITLHKAFFDRYALSLDPSAIEPPPAITGSVSLAVNSVKCQVNLKATNSAFHSQSLNNVEKLLLAIDSSSNRLILQHHCKRGIVKTYKIPFEEEGEALEARYDVSNCGTIVLRPRVLLDALSNFKQTSLDELSLVLPPNSNQNAKIQLHSTPPSNSFSSNGDSSASTAVYTELSLDPHTLDEYNVPGIPTNSNQQSNQSSNGYAPISITFSMKDFKHVCSLCDSVAQPMTIQATRGGFPMVISTKYFNAFEAVFVQATLLEQQPQQTPSSTQQSSGTKQKQQIKQQQQQQQSVQIKQSPSTPATEPNMMLKKRKETDSQQQQQQNDNNELQQELKRQKQDDHQVQQAQLSGNTNTTQPATPAVLPCGRLFLGDKDINDEDTNPPQIPQQQQQKPQIESENQAKNKKLEVPSDDDEDLMAGIQRTAPATTSTTTNADNDEVVPASCPKL